MLGIYVRLSQVDDSSNSIENQLRQGKEFAKSKNLEYKVYDEGQGLSGGLGEEGRPMLSSLLNDVRNDIITSIWVRDQSRLERKTLLYLTIIDLCQEKEVKLFYGDKFVDVDNDEEMLPSNIISLVNQMNRRKQGRLTKKAINDNFKESKSHGILPYGFTSDENRKLIINGAEAAIVKRIYAMSLSGIGTSKIAEILNSEDVSTRYNSMQGTIKIVDKHSKRVTVKKKSDIKWSGNTIRNIIRNPAYKGERRSRIKTDPQHYPCPAIFEENYWADVNVNLHENSNNSGKFVEHKYLLKGLIRCGKCGRNYYGRTRVNKKDNFYMCSGKRIKTENCGNRSINIGVIEDLIWTTFVENGTMLEVIKNHFKQSKEDNTINELTESKEQLQKDLAEVNKTFKRLIDLAISGTFTDEELKPKKKEITTAKNDIELKIKRIDESLNSLLSSESQISDMEADLARINNITFEQKRELLKRYLCDVMVRFRDDLNRFYEGGEYFVEIGFKMANMDSYVYVLSRNYQERTIMPKPEGHEVGTFYWNADIFGYCKLK